MAPTQPEDAEGKGVTIRETALGEHVLELTDDFRSGLTKELEVMEKKLSSLGLRNPFASTNSRQSDLARAQPIDAPNTSGPIEIGPNENCNRDCVECWPQFKTADMPGLDVSLVVKKVNDFTAGQTAKGLAVQAGKDRIYVQIKLAQYGDVIRMKWKNKMTKAKRETIILKAQLNLYRYKLPELRTMFGYDEIFGGQKHKYFNVNDSEAISKAQSHTEMLKNSQLLPYLNVETLKEDPMRLLSLPHHRSSSKLEDWVMSDVAQMKAGVESGTLSRQYNEGCVIMYGERYGQLVRWHRAQCHRWNCIGYPRAVLVLEAQSVLMGFLRRTVDLIVPENANGTASGFKASGEVAQWSSLGNQPFSTPPVFNSVEALTGAKAQLAAAEDHLRFLQTEPAYFHDLLARQRRGEHFAPMHNEKVWGLIVADVTVFPTAHVQRLRYVVDECEHVVTMHKQYQDNIKLGTALPKDTSASSSRSFSGFIDDHLAHATKKERARIDQTLYDHLARMSVYGEIFLTLRATRPLSAASSFAHIMGSDEEKQRVTWRLWRSTPGNLTDAEKSKLSTLLQAFYDCPMPTGKKNREWLYKAAESRKRLAFFWRYAAEVRRREVTGIGYTAADIEEDVALFEADQSGEYKVEAEAEQAEVARIVDAEVAAKAKAAGKMGSAQTAWGHDGERRSKAPIERVKVKTRPEAPASTTAEEMADADEATTTEEARPHVAVNAESLRIFARMFPLTAEVVFKGVVKWQHFVTAMADAGCSATHTGGSAVSFDRAAKDGRGGGTIVFHKPHPEHEVDHIILQTMGKRLRKWFGWDGDVFVEREKERK